YDGRVESPTGDLLDNGAPTARRFDCVTPHPDRLADRRAGPGVALDNQDRARVIHGKHIVLRRCTFADSDRNNLTALFVHIRRHTRSLTTGRHRSWQGTAPQLNPCGRPPASRP